MSQTTIQKNDSLRFGSTKLEIGTSALTLVDVGAIRAMKPVSKAENSELQFDNCASITKFMKGDRFAFQFSLAEVDLTTLSKTDAGLIVLTNNAGTPVSGESQVVAASTKAYNEFIKIENQNGDGSIITINSVTAGDDGLLVAETDYFVIENSQGVYGIIIADAGTVTDMDQTFTIDYDYTPNASKTITFNTTGQKTPMYARITNVNNDGKALTIDLANVSNIKPIELPFISDNEDDVMTVEMELEGNIVSMIDEQSVS